MTTKTRLSGIDFYGDNIPDSCTAVTPVTIQGRQTDCSNTQHLTEKAGECEVLPAQCVFVFGLTNGTPNRTNYKTTTYYSQDHKIPPHQTNQQLTKRQRDSSLFSGVDYWYGV